jgi:hypothetical protein
MLSALRKTVGYLIQAAAPSGDQPFEVVLRRGEEEKLPRFGLFILRRDELRPEELYMRLRYWALGEDRCLRGKVAAIVKKAPDGRDDRRAFGEQLDIYHPRNLPYAPGTGNSTSESYEDFQT